MSRTGLNILQMIWLGGEYMHANMMGASTRRENMASVAAQYAAWRSLQINQCYTVTFVDNWRYITPTLEKKQCKASCFSVEYLVCFEHQRMLSLHLPPRRRMQPAAVNTSQLLTFLLSHAFVLPGAAEQHQPHSLSDTELRERASRLWSTDNRCPTTTAARPAVVLLWVGRSPAAAHTASSCLLPARFCGASFKRAAGQWNCSAGGAQDKGWPTRNTPWLINAWGAGRMGQRKAVQCSKYQCRFKNDFK